MKRIIATAALFAATLVPNAPAIAQGCNFESSDFMRCRLNETRQRQRQQERERYEWLERENQRSHQRTCSYLAILGYPCHSR